MEKKTRVLVVEDNPDDQELLTHLLHRARLTAQVEIAADGQAALDYLVANHSFSDQLIVVFLDLNLPTFTGLELLQRIRGDDRLRHLPVVVMTSSNSPADLAKCQQLGISSFIQKPLSAASFSSAIAGVFHSPTASSNRPRIAQKNRFRKDLLLVTQLSWHGRC